MKLCRPVYPTVWMLIFILLFSQGSGFTASAELPVPATGASAFVLWDAEEGKALCGENENRRLPMASTTKIMTALTVLRFADPGEVLTVPKEAAGIEGSSMYLEAGEKLTVEALLYGLLLESANDAAVALAVGLRGSTDAFAACMNAEAARMGMSDTHFVTVNGLDDPDHFTTAAELAKITAAALEQPLFRKIVSTVEKVVVSVEGRRFFLRNHNRLLWEYAGCIGVKTGYTMRSGRCLVSAAERDGLTLIAVTLGDRQDWKDHTVLLNYGFLGYRRILLAEKGALRVGEYFNPTDLFVTVPRQEAPLPVTLTVSLRQETGEAVFTVGEQSFSYTLVKETI